MSASGIAWVVGAVLLACWALGAHNRLVALRGEVLAAWSRIEQAATARDGALQALLPLLRGPLGREHEALDTLVGVMAQLRTSLGAVRQMPFRPGALEVVAAYEIDLDEAWAHVRALIDAEAPSHEEALPLASRVHVELTALLAAREAVAAARAWFNDRAVAHDAALLQMPTRLLKPWFGFEQAGRL